MIKNCNVILKKKAEDPHEPKLIASIVILLVALIILLLFFYKSYDKQKTWEQIDSCRKSVELNAESKIKGIVINNEPIQCPTAIIKVTDKDEQLIQKKIADQMAYCWYKFGEGNKDIFDPLTNEQKDYCAICSLISFDAAAKQKQIPHFLSYLNQNKIPVVLGNKNYTQYLTKVITTSNEAAAQNINTQTQQTQDMINTNLNYAVVLLYAKKGYPQRLQTTAAGAAIGSLVAPTTFILTTTGVIGAAGIGIIGTVIGGILGYEAGSDTAAAWSAATILWPYTENALQGLGCDEFPVEQQTKTNPAVKTEEK